MTTDIDAPLNESLRDAMLAMYLHEGVANDPYLVEQKLVDRIKTPNDLYEYWLLDVLVSQNVPTSPVACAIASLQQLINSMMLNMEPGYGNNSLSPEHLKAWQNGENRYPIWAAIQQLHHFPDIYLDPTLRLTKTDSFEQLENDINQAQIQPDTVQAAVLAYLARFEEVANLKLCNGYIDGKDFANSTYYFIAKSPAENAFYWRALDMRQRPQIAPAIGPSGIAPKLKYDKPLPNAWTDWKRANVPISEKALEHTIRPCWFNNRLLVVWAEVEYQDPDMITPGPTGKSSENSIKAYPLFRLYGSYKKYDDSWSTPRVYIENYCQTPGLIAKTPEEIKRLTQTIAVFDNSTSPESMVLMLYSNYVAGNDASGDKDTYDFLRTVRIDKNFNVTALYPSQGVVPNIKQALATATPLENDPSRKHVLLIGYIFANPTQNEGRFQYWLPTSVPDFGAVEHDAPKAPGDTWNFNQWQSRIRRSEKDVDLVYDRTRSNIDLTVRLDAGFPGNNIVTLDIYEDDAKTNKLFFLLLIFNESSYHNERYTLLEGSLISPVGTDWLDQQGAQYSFVTSHSWKNLIIEAGAGGDKFSLPQTAKGGTAFLEGKRLYKHMLEDIISSPKNQLSEFWRYTSRTDKFKVGKNVDSAKQGPLGYQFFVAHPTKVTSDTPPTSFEQMRMLHTSSIFSSLSRDSTLGYSFSINQATHRPDGWPVEWPDNSEDLKIPLIYGVLVYERGFTVWPPSYGWQLKGGALKTLSIGWGAVVAEKTQIAPGIHKLPVSSPQYNPSLGEAQFIDFTGSSIQCRDGEDSCSDKEDSLKRRSPIRMNTTFVRHLIEQAEKGMASLLSWDTQHMKEPAIPNGQGAEPMDFSGAYYLYFLELFLYLPWLVAYRLNEEQQYEEAKRWLAFVFDPSRQSGQSRHPGYWQSVPLEEPVWPRPADPSQAILYPDDPHQIALSFPVHFRKALYGLYIDIESNQADAAYRELTPDGLAEAKLRYVRILDFLGPRPDFRQIDDWHPVNLETLSTAKNPELREFEQQLIEAQQSLQHNPPLRIGKAPASEVAPLLCLRPYAADPTVPPVDNPYLRRPFNPELIQRWERAESRLYNLRHNLDMAGNALNLPLFAAPLDPRALLAAWGQGLSGSALNRLLSPQIPHYRFSFMFALAQSAVEGVMQFGSTLLSLIERKEQAQYLELQQQQAWNLAKVAVDIQVQTGKIDEKNKEALLASQAIIASRLAYYEKLLTDGLTSQEVGVGDSLLSARHSETAGGITSILGELAKVPPNIFGTSSGGYRAEGVFNAGANIAYLESKKHFNAADNLGRTGQYQRRAQEWTQARDQAKLEAEQIKAQLEVYEAQHKATQLQLRQAQTALNQAKATHDFLLSSNRFSKSQTYDWLNSKFASFYYTAFNTAQSLCQAAEACWQYEMGDFRQTFIRPGAWNNSYRGLGAGEELKMSLQQMYREYVQNNKRDLEIRKTVSLKTLKAKDSASTINKTWEDLKADLTSSGTCAFELTPKMFDDDYDGQNHYLRRIKSISVSLPVTVGPYEDIRAVLSQSYSKVEMLPTAGTFKENLKVSQQIALSHGVDDNGLFQLNFQDERYQPFEYTGAISRWTLIFPNPQVQKAMLESLNDIIIHVFYSARSGGGSL
ncbi:neuraminidase-like domain-containing protein [Pseudomonas sp. GL-RE-19]|uniref:Tc toxin subunit A-related protein n=1 Tax=Pseudomonas sp. GL-RE-19 TaxID=2832389 RepID=UPI002958A011|nr:neuraminidase-like domain-containing protein [Pseudomonas sp. GL-RE-19]